ncbi:DUF3182 domain-containing protein, partial [Pseudomonas sp. FIP_A4]
MINADTSNPRRVVMTYANRAREPEHERRVHAAMAEQLAGLLGLSYGGEYDPTRGHETQP